MSVFLRRAFVAASIAWAMLLVAVPFVASGAHLSSIAAASVVAVYGIGSLVCHQLPQRSYRLWSAQMPVCARCAGIYAGAATASLLALIAPRRADARAIAERAGTGRARAILAVAAAPSLATLVYEWATRHAPSNAIRFAAGLPIGIAVAWLLVAASEDQVN